MDQEILTNATVLILQDVQDAITVTILILQHLVSYVQALINVHLVLPMLQLVQDATTVIILNPILVITIQQ